MRRSQEKSSKRKVWLGLALLLCPAISEGAQDLGSKLIDTARTQDSEGVRKLLAAGADPNAKDKSGRTALMEAAFGGYTETLHILLEKGAEVNAQDTVGWSALMRAAFSRRNESIRLLLEKGADVKAKDKEGRTALFWAATSGHTDTVRLLNAKGARVNVKDAHGWTPLMSAADLGYVDTVRELLAKGADPTVKDRDGNTAKSLAEKYEYKDVAGVLQSALDGLKSRKVNETGVNAAGKKEKASGEDPKAEVRAKKNEETTAGGTAPRLEKAAPSKSEILNQRFLGAAGAGDTVEALKLIREGAGVNAHDPAYGNTGLMDAAARGYTETVRSLLEKGADINATDNAGHTALMQAAFGGYTAAVRLLLEKGAQVNGKDNDGWTPLFWATFSRRAETVRLLLESGADVNVKNKQQDTPLIHAAYGGDTDTVAALLEHHADLNIQDETGRTALLEAIREERGETVRILVGGGAALDVKDRDGNTAMSLALKQNSTGIVELLKKPAENRTSKPHVDIETPATTVDPASDPTTNPLVAAAQAEQRRSEARAFYGLGLSIRFLEELGTGSARARERAAAALLEDLRRVQAPEELTNLGQKISVQIMVSRGERDETTEAQLTELTKGLDKFLAAQTDGSFFYNAGGFTYELNQLGHVLQEGGNATTGAEETRSKLFQSAVELKTKCAKVNECKDRALNVFAESASGLQPNALGAGEGAVLQKLADDIAAALGSGDR